MRRIVINTITLIIIIIIIIIMGGVTLPLYQTHRAGDEGGDLKWCFGADLVREYVTHAICEA